MTTIYGQHYAAFKLISAYVVLKDDELVATIAFKFPRDGAGRLTVYVHWIGAEMVRGFAGGFGYDKRSAACANAAPKLKLPPEGSTLEWERAQYANGFAAFVEALEHDGGESWEMRLYQAGFTVLQAV